MAGEYTDFLDLPGARLQRIPNHVELAIKRMRPRFRNKPRAVAIVTAIAKEVQALEDAIWQVRTRAMVLDNAEGDSLDRFASLLNVARNGRTDDALRARLAVEILVNRSHGRINELIAIIVAFEDIDDTNGSVHIWDRSGAATLIVEVLHLLSQPAGDLMTLLRRAKAAGVELHLHYTPGGPDGSLNPGSAHSVASLTSATEGAGSAHSVGTGGGCFAGTKR